MNISIIQFFALFLLMLVTGIFWGPWFALHRSIKVFNANEFIRIVNTMSANLARPMQIMMPFCVICIVLSVWLYPRKDSLGFYLEATSFILILVSLLVTVLVEVPIVTSIRQWTAETIPSDWQTIRDRWVKFHVVRTFAALASIACFIASILWK
ncbi:MAG: anthrone oxygenase family protein [Cytophagaceae bacterium]